MSDFYETLLLMAVPVLWLSAVRFLVRRENRLAELEEGASGTSASRAASFAGR